VLVAGPAAIGTARVWVQLSALLIRVPWSRTGTKLVAEFLNSASEDGTVGRLRKVMSDEFIKAEMALFAAQATEVDIYHDSAQAKQHLC